MNKYKKLIVTLLITVFGLALVWQPAWAEPPEKNIVIAAGETWGTYVPANYDFNWGRKPVITDITQINLYHPQGNVFFTGRLVGSQFVMPQWSWISGRQGMDFEDGAWAVEFNPGEDFAVANEPIVGADDKHYANLRWVPTVAGANDPARNYHDPANGGANLSADRTHAWGMSAWPTTVGVDVKLTAHSWTMPWGHLDDFHIVEIELYNTGQTDLNGDGTVELTNNRINALTFTYWPGCFHFYIGSAGTRGYYVNNNRYRASIFDATLDENGFPWDIHCQAIGSKWTPPDAQDHPGVTDGGEYYDAYNGYNWLGAKKWNPDTQQWEEKFLCFKDANGNEIVPTVGEGVQRGWFHTNQPGWGNVGPGRGDEKKAHISAMGCFFVDGGKSNDGAAFDLNPNPAIFASGTAGDPTTFIVKNPSQWTYPDGAWEKATPVMVKDPITGADLGINPIDPYPGRGGPMEPGIIKEGVISQYQFDGDPLCSFGPLALEVGERVRVYFYRGSGFRIHGLRKTVKAARAVFESIQPDGSYVVPQSPPVPEIKITLEPETFRALVNFADPGALGDNDGIKIYKAVSFPRYKSTEKLYPTHDTWWKSMDPNTDPGQSEISPLLNVNSQLLRDQQADFWGPYSLVKVIPKSEFSNYTNTGSDATNYPYVWLDDTFSAIGQSVWYYVATYKQGAAANVPSAFQGLDTATWLESGKVNINGRTGHWEDTWPWSWKNAYYPDETDKAGLKDIGAVFVLVTPTVSVADIELSREKIGVRPNPYKRVAFHDARGQHQILFYNLPSKCTIQIYDLSGMLIDEIDFLAPDPNNGTFFWDMFSKNGNEVASGLYIWVVKYDGGMQHDTFAIIR